MTTKSSEKRELWQRIIEEQETSGKTQVRFCTDEGINVNNFQYWRRQLAGQDGRAINDIVQISCIPLLADFPPLEFETDGIRIPLAGGTACLTISGRLSLLELSGLVEACTPRSDNHVPA
jgi:hypothetical protein